jgi:hypothetical protein
MAIKQVGYFRRREEEDEGQLQELQSLVAEVNKLQKLMTKQGVPLPSLVPSSSPANVNQEGAKFEFSLKPQVQ